MSWNLGNIAIDSWTEIVRRTRRLHFASKKTLAHPECMACEYQPVCHAGCPKLRHGPHGRFEDLDALGPLREEVARLFGQAVPPAAKGALSPY